MRGGPGEAHPDPTDLAGLGVRHRALGVLDGADDLLRRPDERLALRGEPHRAGGALEERAAEVALQLLDGAAQRWLGHVQPLRGPTEVELLGHREERPDVVQLHRWLLSAGPPGHPPLRVPADETPTLDRCAWSPPFQASP
ncbi:hypothetical protein GCM10027055_07020 [Janibacter alkaliphilus]